MPDTKSPRGPSSDPPLDSPPPYSPARAGGESSRPRGPARVPGLPVLLYEQYSPASASVSTDGVTVTVADPVIASNPTALAAFLRTQATLPPFVTMRVTGTSWGPRYQADFDVTLNLMRYFIHEPEAPAAAATASTDGGRRDGAASSHVQLNLQGLPTDTQSKFRKKELTVQSLAQAFCSDRLTPKSLIITRRVSNLDESILKARVMQMLGELKYKGEVEVTFPIRMGKVRVVPSNSALDKFVGFFSRPRDYAAMEVVWPYAAAPPAGPEQHETGASTGRGFVVRSEEGLWHDWRPAFERAVLSGRHGWVTLEDLMEAKMGLPGPKMKTMEWGVPGNYTNG